MACRLVSAKPLSEPMLEYGQLDPWEQISMKLLSDFKHFKSRKCIWNVVWKMAAIMSRPQCVNDLCPYVFGVPQSLCSPEMFSSPVSPHAYITQSLFSPASLFRIIPSRYVSQSLCPPVSILARPCASQWRYSLRLIFPSLIFPSPYAPQSLCSPVSLNPSPDFPQTYFLVPMFSKHVHQLLCSSNMFTSPHCHPHILAVHSGTFTVFVIPRGFSNPCSPRMLHSPNAP